MIDLTPKQIENIVPILTNWIVNENIDEVQCESKLLDAGLLAEEVDFCMEAVNTIEVDNKGVESVLIEAIELANYDEDAPYEPDERYEDYLRIIGYK